MIQRSPCKLLWLAAVCAAVTACALKPAESPPTAARDSDCAAAANPLHRVSSSSSTPEVDPEIESLLGQESHDPRLRQINVRMYHSLQALDVELRREQALAACRQSTVGGSILEAQSTTSPAQAGNASRSAPSSLAASQSSLVVPGNRKANVSPTGVAGNGATAPKIVPGSDNDIVARRLRKAAEQEPDPTLRAKLWKEYVEYRQGNLVAK